VGLQNYSINIIFKMHQILVEKKQGIKMFR
jgi:hypothetical protein